MPPGRPRTAKHGTDTRYTSGKCRCAKCRSAHAAVAAERRATQYGPGAAMGPEVRGAILRLLGEGRSVKTAAAAAGTTHQAVYGAAKALPEFGREIERLTAATQPAEEGASGA